VNFMGISLKLKDSRLLTSFAPINFSFYLPPTWLLED